MKVVAERPDGKIEQLEVLDEGVGEAGRVVRVRGGIYVLDPSPKHKEIFNRLSLAASMDGPDEVILQQVEYMLKMPIDMKLWCPKCGVPHVDAPNPSMGWTNPPHRSHLCHVCHHVWRPADVPTNGVIAIKTKGKGDH